MTTPFEAFVNGELPKRVLTEASPTSWTPGLLLATTGVALGVEAVEVTSLGLEPTITGSGVTTEFWNGEKSFVSITAGDVGAIPVSDRGALSGVASLDETGKIPLSQIPASAIERVVVVADETARFALTIEDVQRGDVVDQQTPKAIYFVVDDANLGNAAGYSELVVGTAAAVAWSGVTGIPVIISDIAGIAGSINGDVLQKVGGGWVNRTTAQLKTSLAIATSDVSGLDTALGLKAPLESPTFTGTVVVPTVLPGDSSTSAASTAFVGNELTNYAQPLSSTLTALSAYNSDGFVVQIDFDTFTSRSLVAGQGITILNSDAVSANPTISITDTAVTPGTYGSATKIPSIVVDSMGRVTDASEVDNGVFSDSVFRLQDNLAPTKQVAFELSGITAGQTRTITMPDYDVNLGIVGIVPAYTNSTVYAAGSEVTYLGRLYVCNTAHTSSTAVPDFTKFYPANGMLVTAIASGTYTPPINSDIQEYVVLASGSFTYQSDAVTTKRITVINTSASSTVTVSATPDALVEGAAGYTNPPALEVGEQLAILGTTYSRTGQTVNSGLFKLRTTGGSGFSVTFNTSAVAANRVVTIPNAAVDLGKVPTGISYDATTGFVTLANTDGSTSSTATTGPITDALFRIQSNTDATRKIAFSCTSIGAGQTRTITMPNANVALGKVPTGFTYTSGTGVLSISTSDSSQYTVTLGTLPDTLFRIADNSDATKLIAFEAAALTTGQTRTITMPDANVNLGLIGAVPDYVNGGVYALGNEVSYLGASYLCNTAHTSSTAAPDFTKFYPVSGVLEVYSTTTSFTVPDNTNIKLVRLQVTTSTMVIAGLNSSIQDGRVEISNALQGSVCTVTVSGPTVFREQNDTATSTSTALVLAGLESAYITCIANNSNAYWRKIRTNSFLAENTRLRKTGTVGNTAYATFNATALSAIRTITLPDADVNLGTIPSVATAYGTLTAGQTRCQIMGGSGNTMQATAVDSVAVGCTSVSISGTNVVAINCASSTISGANNTLTNCKSVTTSLSNIRAEGSLVAPAIYTFKQILKGACTTTGTTELTDDNSGTATASNAPKAALQIGSGGSGWEGAAIHKLKIVAYNETTAGFRDVMWIGERVVKVLTRLQITTEVHELNTSTIGTDLLRASHAAANVNVVITAPSGPTSPLTITVSETALGFNPRWTCEVESTYLPAF